uniref:Phosphatidate cytidylyltransferase n=1 Tax=Globisporangium ultimum (strain ATCC 200006 / CBS 805.95 / DAOM BR144) TaxID=431595 RepID=K3X3J2_GLOUD
MCSFVDVKLPNIAQRILSSLVLAPLITYFLWRSPAFATTTVCSVLVSVSCYEYAWLAFRIQHRFTKTYENFELKLAHLSISGRESQLSSMARSPSISAVRLLSPDSNTSRLTQSNSNEPQFFHSTDQLQQPHFEANEHEIQEEMIASRGKRCAITPLSSWCWFGGEWAIAIAVSVVGSALLSLVLAWVISRGISTTDHEFEPFQVYYAVISSFATCICASFTPHWTYAVLLVIEQLVFTALTVYSMKCPINNFHCDDVVHPLNIMIGGVFGILVFRAHTSKSPTAFFLALVLDLVGYVYIIGTLFLIVSFVDIDRKATYRKLVIALLYVVWASDSGAYLLGQLFDYFQYAHRHPLAPHLSMNKDYEGTLGAIVFGVCAMFVASDLLDIRGSVAEKLLFAVCAVIVGRIGDLFESLLKRAALVKDSGTLIPGHGGVLDRIDALMFAAIVFSRYFAAIILPKES